MRIIKAHISIIYLQTFFGLMLMLALPTILHAQEKQSRFIDRLSIESKINYGFIILHHPEMWALTDGYFPIVEASLLLQTDEIGRASCRERV